MFTLRLFIISLLIVSSLAVDSSCEDNENGVCSSNLSEASIPKFANELGKPQEATADCVDREDACADFKAQGECTTNPGWMIVNCAKSCDACHLRDFGVRCSREALNVSTTPGYQPGDMNAMFSSIQSRFGDKYDIQVLSTDPWVITFDGFVADKEIDALLTTVDKWERSTDTGSLITILPI